jgi:starch-binding outer membrane protein, SusD/RagB family
LQVSFKTRLIENIKKITKMNSVNRHNNPVITEIKGRPFYLFAVIAVFCCSLIVTSCTKVISNVQNLSGISQTTVWSDPNSIALLVNYIYTVAVPDNFGSGYSGTGNNLQFRYTEGNITDEGRPSATFVGRTNGINNGVSFLAAGCPFQIWPYDIIRQCNDFLQKINTLYPLPASATQSLIAQRNTFIGTVRFFRAYEYWRMVQIYGGVPIVSTVLNAGDSALYAPRNTQEECFQFIWQDLDSAASLLPVANPLGRGSISKGTALALLSRVLLNRASPMYNPNNNTQYWQDAADAAQAVISLKAYSLDPQFGQWFFGWDKSSPENIWQIEYSYPLNQHGWDAANMPVAPWAIGDASATCPTEELVEAFPMINGKAITDPTSGYNPNDPYANRDPRMRATVIVNGDVFGANPKVLSDDYGTPNGPGDVLGAGVRIWSFQQPLPAYGSDAYNNGYSTGSYYNTSTGYYMRKAMDTSLLAAVPPAYNYGVGSSSDWIEIRYAEVLLNYAEAENALGNTAPAYTYIGQIRQRAGVLPGADGNYGIPAGLSQSAMSNFIENERFIEFAFENKRYWDLKRLKLATTVLSLPTHAMVITRLQPASVVPYTTNASDYSFNPSVINVNDIAFPPVFQDKYYFLPLPQSQLLLNKNLTQNPLW